MWPLCATLALAILAGPLQEYGAADQIAHNFKLVLGHVISVGAHKHNVLRARRQPVDLTRQECSVTFRLERRIVSEAGNDLRVEERRTIILPVLFRNRVI